MTESRSLFIRVLQRELLTLLLLLLVGVFLLPLAVYQVGTEIFGEYTGSGFGSFYRDIHGNLRAGEPVVVFLMASPYLVWQLLRLSLNAFRLFTPAHRAPEKS
jgi:hypothetical protein